MFGLYNLLSEVIFKTVMSARRMIVLFATRCALVLWCTSCVLWRQGALPLGQVKFACTHVSMCGQMPTGRCILYMQLGTRWWCGVYMCIWRQKFVQTNLSKINTNVCRNSCFKMAVSTCLFDFIQFGMASLNIKLSLLYPGEVRTYVLGCTYFLVKKVHF